MLYNKIKYYLVGVHLSAFGWKTMTKIDTAITNIGDKFDVSRTPSSQSTNGINTTISPPARAKPAAIS